MGCCGFICYQDLKYRAVYWFLFPILALSLGLLHFLQTTAYIFMTYSLINILLITIILAVLWGYAHFVAKKKFLNHSFGLGDLLFFYACALGFPSYTFILLFVGAIFFSLISYLFLKRRLTTKTVPLAGLMSIFLFGCFAGSLCITNPSLYTY